MAEGSTIEWTDATWNPVAGCTIVSPGCTNCYAMRLAGRLQAMGLTKYDGLTRKSGGRPVWTGRVRLDEASLDVPLRWRRPRRVFVNSMSDLFHDSVPDAFIDRVWKTIRSARQHTFQVLTKRPERMRAYVTARGDAPLGNLWLGTSVERAAEAPRIDELRGTPAAIRFVSFEPLIADPGSPSLDGIHWAIVGGESGPGARPMQPEWVDRLRVRCAAHGTAFFFKQWGGRNKRATGRILHGRTWDEYPAAAA